MALWNNTDAEASKPKYLNEADKAATLGLDVAEAQEGDNIEIGLTTPGWVKYTTYVDSGGQTRHKSEVLVAMSSITGDNDELEPNPTVSIDVQPENVSVETPEDAEFSVVASTDNDPTELTYQWQVSTDGLVWTDVDGAESATLTVVSDDDEYVDGNEFRVVVTATVGGDSETSDAATLTVTEPEPENP